MSSRATDAGRATKEAERWYFRGREARGRGWARRTPARLNPANREEWLRGWDDEAREQASGKATPAERAESLEVAARLRAWAREQSARVDEVYKRREQ